jgi:hypothetical protein
MSATIFHHSRKPSGSSPSHSFPGASEPLVSASHPLTAMPVTGWTDAVSCNFQAIVTIFAGEMKIKMLTAEEIKSIADSGEGYNVDFKLSVPSKVRELSQDVCAFANSEGGYILIGIDNKNQIVGAAINNTKRSAIQDAVRDISPAINVNIYSIVVDGKTVWVMDVHSGKDKPYVTSGAIYVRENTNSQKLTTAEEIRSFFLHNDIIIRWEEEKMKWREEEHWNRTLDQ